MPPSVITLKINCTSTYNGYVIQNNTEIFCSFSKFSSDQQADLYDIKVQIRISLYHW